METPVVGEGWTEWTWLERTLNAHQLYLIYKYNTHWTDPEMTQLDTAIDGLTALREF